MKIRAKERQTLLDIALMIGGRVETVFDLAEANGLSVTDRLEEGQELRVPERVANGDARTVRLYRARGIEPATEASAEDLAACPYGGIGFMGIEIDFTVS